MRMFYYTSFDSESNPFRADCRFNSPPDSLVRFSL